MSLLRRQRLQSSSSSSSATSRNGSNNRQSLLRCGLASLVVAQAAAGTLPAAHDGLQVNVTRSLACSRETHDGDAVLMHYNGTLADGTPFDSSHDRGTPFGFTLGAGNVIRGWDLGLVGMCPGEERTLTLAPELGYGQRDLGVIPPDSTLVFETQLVEIVGVAPESPAESSSESSAESPAAGSAESAAEIATESAAPQTDTTDTTAADAKAGDEGSSLHYVDEETADGKTAYETQQQQDGPMASAAAAKDGECKLLGPFALVVQAALGVLALSSLVFKRWRERPRRPLKIWFFDASKQVFGSALLHVFNVLLSMVSSGAVEMTTQASAGTSATSAASAGANPCSFYLINIAVDTTVGIPILVLLLKVLGQAALVTPLADPPESIRSGYYGSPPRATWWLKQSCIYFVGLLLMKLCVFFIFQLLPWIVWVGNWALRWTEGSEALQIAFVMFVFPLIMNALQYYIIDTFIKDRSKTPHGHEAVATDDDDDDDDNFAQLDNGLVDDDEDDEHSLDGDDSHHSQRQARDAHGEVVRASDADKDGIGAEGKRAGAAAR